MDEGHSGQCRASSGAIYHQAGSFQAQSSVTQVVFSLQECRIQSILFNNIYGARIVCLEWFEAVDRDALDIFTGVHTLVERQLPVLHGEKNGAIGPETQDIYS